MGSSGARYRAVGWALIQDHLEADPVVDQVARSFRGTPFETNSACIATGGH
jgi:hypothetical protein